MKKTLNLLLLLLTLSSCAMASGRIQNEDVKSLANIQAAVLTTTGNLSMGSACISSLGSTSGLVAGLFIYDSTTSSNITSGTTIAGVPGTCPVGQVQMSLVAAGNGSGDTITFGGQISQLINDTKIYATGSAQLLSAVLSNITGTNMSTEITNLTLSAGVSANALTMNVKTKAGVDPSGGDPVKIAFRSATATSGLYLERSITASLAVTVPSGASLGTISAQDQYIYLYAIDNAGTVELAVSGSRIFDQGSLQNTTALSGASTSATVLYSTVARTNVPIRFIGRTSVNEATAGTYASAPTELSLSSGLDYKLVRSMVELYGGNGMGSTNTVIRRFTTIKKNIGSDISYADSATLGNSFTINADGLYCMTYEDSSGTNPPTFGISVNSNQLTTSIFGINPANMIILVGQFGPGVIHDVSSCYQFSKGDVVRAHTDGNPDGTGNNACKFIITKVAD